MKKKSAQCIKIVAVLVALLYFTGCWDKKELDSIAIVMGIGIDQSEQPEMIDFTAQIGKVAQKKSGEKDSSGSAYLTLKTTSESVFEAIRSFSHENSRRLFMQHNQVLVFGKNQAEKGVESYVDFFLRDHEARMQVQVLVAEGTANEALSTESDLESVPSVNLMRLIKNQGITSQSFGVSLLEFVSRLNSKTTAPMATLIKIVEDDGKPKLSLSGMAVFKKDMLVGQLSEDETRGYLWVVNKVKSGVINVTTDSGKARVEITDHSRKMETSIQKDGNITVSLHVTVESGTREITGFENMMITDVVSVLEQETKKQIKDEIEKAFEKAQRLNADIFAIGDAVHRKYPKKWDALEANWDEIFPTIKVTVEVESILRDTGKITKSLNREE